MARLRFPMPLRWSDMDAYGHVNNVVFLRLLEDARVLAFHAHDSEDGGTMLDTGVLVARHEIDYVAPLHWRPDPVSIDLWVTDIKGASFDMGYEVLDDDADGGPPTVYARAESTLVVYDLAQGRPRRMSDVERERLESWRGEPVNLRRHRVEQRRGGSA
ncbi:MAG: acyl-CoA thioesterase [Actinomycetota bacterium]